MFKTAINKEAKALYIESAPIESEKCKITMAYCLYIQTPRRPSWREFKRLMKRSHYSFDARKVKGAPILSLELPCGNKLDVWKVKDFPNGDADCLCGCGNSFIKWELL